MKWLDSGFDARAVRFEERGQGECFAEVLGVLAVRGEAWAVGGDFKQNAARDAEVERFEIVPLDLAGGPAAVVFQMFLPVQQFRSSLTRHATWWTPPAPSWPRWVEP